MAWIYVLAAGLLEVVWAVGLKYTDGFTRFWPSVVMVVTFSGSLFLLALAVQTIPMGTAYAMFVGIGAVGAALLGIFLFGSGRRASRFWPQNCYSRATRDQGFEMDEQARTQGVLALAIA